MILTNGFDKMFLLDMSYAFISKHRKAIGIEGTWQAYFDLLKSAIADGDQGIKVVKVEKQSDTTDED